MVVHRESPSGQCDASNWKMPFSFIFITENNCITIKLPAGHGTITSARSVSRSVSLQTQAVITFSCPAADITLTWLLRQEAQTDVSQQTISMPDPAATKTTARKSWPGLSLAAGVYSIQVTAMHLTANATDSDTTYVNVKRAGLEAIIDGGSSRTVSVNKVMHVDARSRSHDPETSLVKTGLSFVWACVDSDGASCQTRFDAGRTSQSAAHDGYVYIRTASLGVGTYLFTVIVTKDTRNTSASQTVRIVAGYIPEVKLRWVWIDAIKA